MPLAAPLDLAEAVHQIEMVKEPGGTGTAR